jgi:BMFP domain-containing protein YqiC
MLVFSGRFRYQARMDKDSIESLAGKLAASVPEGLRVFRQDLEKNFRAVLASGLASLDLVTREEFEVQEAVLRRTREKLAALEARLAEYESRQR